MCMTQVYVGGSPPSKQTPRVSVLTGSEVSIGLRKLHKILVSYDYSTQGRQGESLTGAQEGHGRLGLCHGFILVLVWNGAMITLVKCLSHRHENLSLILRTHMRNHSRRA